VTTVGRHIRQISNEFIFMSWLYWQLRLLVGADRWSAHLSDIE